MTDAAHQHTMSGQEGADPRSTSREVPIAEILDWPLQPRGKLSQERIEELVPSIKEHGVLQNILLKPHPEEGRYHLIFGRHRLAAAKLAGLLSIPAEIRDLSDIEALQISLAENTNRKALNPVEETDGILQLLSMKLVQPVDEIRRVLQRLKNTSHNVMANEEEIIEGTFAALGVNRNSFTKNRLPILTLPPDLLGSIREGLEYTKAKEIAKIKDEESRSVLLDEALGQRLSLLEIKARVKAILGVVPSELQQRVRQVYRKLNKGRVWEDPERSQVLSDLLDQIESLL